MFRSLLFVSISCFTFLPTIAFCQQPGDMHQKAIDDITKMINNGQDLNAYDKTGWTPLVRAVDNSNIVACKLLIENGANVNRHSAYHWSPLMHAIKRNNLEIATLLLEAGADVNEYNNGGQTTLLIAVQKKQRDTVKILLEKGADTTAMDPDGKSVLDYAAENNDTNMLKLLVEHGTNINMVNGKGLTCFCDNTSAFNGNHDILNLLLALGADPKIPPVTDTPDPVYYAAKVGETEWAAQLQKMGAVRDVWKITPPPFIPAQYVTKDTWDSPHVEFTDAFNQFLKTYAEAGNAWQFTDVAGNTFLHWVAENKQPNWTEWAIQQGMDVNVRSTFEKTPLHRAAKAIFAEPSIRVLLEYGADVQAIDFLGNTPLHYAASKCDHKGVELLLANNAAINTVNNYDMTPLHCISLNQATNAARMIQVLLVEGADPTIQDFKGETILHLVCKEFDSFPEVLQHIIRKGGDVNQPNKMGEYPLHLAYKYKNLTSILIQSGADLEVRNRKGLTPLVKAILEKKKTVMDALIEAGADVNAATYMGWTPLHYATWTGSTGFVQILIDNGADLTAKTLGKESILDVAKRFKKVKMVTYLEKQPPFINEMDTATTKPFDKEKAIRENLERKKQLKQADDDRIRGNWMYHCSESSLAIAVLESDPNAVREAIEKGEDVNKYHLIPASRYFTSLYMATRFHDDAMVRLLVKLGADISLGQKEPYLQSPLHLAAWEGDLPMTQLLIELGADMHIANGDGKTPFATAVQRSKKNVVKFYQNKGFNVHKKDKSGKSRLHQSVQWSSTVKMLLEQGLDPNVRDSGGNTPLHAYMSTAGADTAGVPRLLVKYGADINAKDDDGNTPLCEALAHDKLETAKFLIEAGADVNIGTSGWKRNGPPIHLANGNIEIMALLLNHGADIHALNKEGQNVIHSLVSSHSGGIDDIATLEYFLEQKVDINGKDEDGQTPIWGCIEFNRIDLLESLIEHGADIEAADKHGRTPLWFAGRNKKTVMVKLLLQYGAKVDVKNKYGKSLKEDLSSSIYGDIPEIIENGG